RRLRRRLLGPELRARQHVLPATAPEELRARPRGLGLVEPDLGAQGGSAGERGAYSRGRIRRRRASLSCARGSRRRKIRAKTEETMITLYRTMLAVVSGLMLLSLGSAAAGQATHQHETGDVPLQPLALAARQYELTLDYLGQPLSAPDRARITQALSNPDEKAAVRDLL